MKAIGYIYRYSEEEKKGILAYGHTLAPYWTLPILFDSKNCDTKVNTGDLVYFDLTENKSASNIEKASLLNFNKEVLDYLVSEYYDFGHKYKYFEKTHIFFEDLSSVEVIVNSKQKDYDCELDEIPGFENLTMPKKVAELFSLFGDKTQYKKEYFLLDTDDEDYTITIDLLDIDLWFDKEMLKSKYYKFTTGEKALYLFDLFEKKRLRPTTNSCGMDEKDDSISENWNHILSIIPFSDLRLVIKKEPMLQPALPISFCNDNLDVLSIDYGFPTVSICEAYFRYRIKKSSSTKDYVLLKDKLSFAINIHSYNYKKEEGAHLNKIKESTLIEMNLLLESQYRNVILENLKISLSKFYGNEDFIEQKVASLIYDNNYSYLQRLGCFIENHEIICENSEFSFIKQYITDFNNLLEEDKNNLKKYVREKVKSCISFVAKQGQASKLIIYVDELGYPMNITREEILNEVREIKDNKFADTQDLDDLDTAFTNNLITESQYIHQYKNLTKDYSFREIVDSIYFERFNKKSLQAQEYLLTKLFKDYNAKSLHEFKYFKHDFLKIGSLYDLIKFCDECSSNKTINKDLWERKRLEIVNNLQENNYDLRLGL